jgi:hypothetical protein
MTAGKGLLLVMMEPPACLEEEFNDWYDTEHLPQRRSLTWFRKRVAVCVPVGMAKMARSLRSRFAAHFGDI